jgi:hypothetical protein
MVVYRLNIWNINFEHDILGPAGRKDKAGVALPTTQVEFTQDEFHGQRCSFLDIIMGK